MIWGGEIPLEWRTEQTKYFDNSLQFGMENNNAEDVLSLGGINK